MKRILQWLGRSTFVELLPHEQNGSLGRQMEPVEVKEVRRFGPRECLGKDTGDKEMGNDNHREMEPISSEQ
jgi:hypothetical protein